MKTRFDKLPLIAAAMMAAAALVSCNRSDDRLLKTVPADSPLVMVADMEKIIENAGGKITDDGIVWDADVKAGADHAFGGQIADYISVVAPYIDMKSIVDFGEGNGHIVTFRITKQSQFEEALAKLDLEKSTLKDFNTYSIRGFSVMQKADQGWMLCYSVEEAASKLDNVLKKASDRPFTDNKQLVEALTDDADDLSIAMSAATFGWQMDAWLVGNLEFGAAAARFEGELMTTEGNDIKVEGLETISTDFLRYVPESFNAAVAVGIEDSSKISDLFASLTSMMSFQQRAMLESIAPFLSKIDGTVALAADLTRVDDGLGAPWLVMAHMKQDDVNTSVNQLVDMLRSMGASVTPAPKNGCFTVSAPGITISIGNVDGNLAIGTVPFDGKAHNSMNSAFQGKEAAFLLNLSQGMVPDVPAMEISGNLQKNEVVLEIKLPDTQEPFLKQMLKTAKRD